MSATVAKVVVGGKLDELTHALESAVGLDSEQNEAEAAIKAEQQANKSENEHKRKQEKWKREKAERHDQGEQQRQSIRDKYQLPSRGGNSSSSKAKPARHTEKEKKCCVS